MIISYLNLNFITYQSEVPPPILLWLLIGGGNEFSLVDVLLLLFMERRFYKLAALLFIFFGDFYCWSGFLTALAFCDSRTLDKPCPDGIL